MTMNEAKIIKDLIGLSGKSPSRIAEDAGLSRSGVLQWLKKGVGIGSRAQDKLLSVLGVSGGTLSPHVVHFWSVKSGDLLPLASILNWAGRSYEMCYISANIRPIDFIDFQTAPLLIHSSHPPFKIVFRHTPPVLLPATKVHQVDSVLVKTGIAKWRDIPKKTPDSLPFIKVDRAVYDKVTEGGISIEEFDQIWNSVKSQDGDTKRGAEEILLSSWEDFIYWAEKMGISPEEAQKCILESHREE